MQITLDTESKTALLGTRQREGHVHTQKQKQQHYRQKQQQQEKKNNNNMEVNYTPWPSLCDFSWGRF